MSPNVDQEIKETSLRGLIPSSPKGCVGISQVQERCIPNRISCLRLQHGCRTVRPGDWKG